MDALGELERWAPSLARHGLQVVLMGGAAAVAHGAAVETKDLDFLFFDSASQRNALDRVAQELGCSVTRPYYRRSLRWRLTGAGVTADFMCAFDGIRDPRALFDRAETHTFGGSELRVAPLADVLASKKASGRSGLRGK